MNIVAILANGVGSRFGSNIPKQFHKVNGKMVIEYVIDSILQSTKTDKLVIATNVSANFVYLGDICKREHIDLIEGGDTRNKTLKNVLEHIAAQYTCNKLIVCDAVRPMITGELIDKYFTALDDCDAVVTAQKITDSLGCYDAQKIDRERYYLMQSPEGFAFPLLYAHFDSASPLTEVTQQLPENSKIQLDFDFTNNFKLTYPADLKYLEALIKDRDNNVDVGSILSGVTRLNHLLENYYPQETKAWQETLQDEITTLLKKWQIESYRLIKTSHFGILFLAKSIKYGKCVLKIIPPFIHRYTGERTCYQSINSSFMCELYDYDDHCSAILLERCDEALVAFDKTDDSLFAFFDKVLQSEKAAYCADDFKSYRTILLNKQTETDFSYQTDLIMTYVRRAAALYETVFSEAEETLIHGDLHRYNIMRKNGSLVAIDPIGYIAPRVFDIARYMGTELTECVADVKLLLQEMLAYFSPLCDKKTLFAALFVDVVFRLHNSLFENDDFALTDKWLAILSKMDEGE